MKKNKDFYHSKYDVLPGTTLAEVMKIAWLIYHEQEKKTKRTVYIKSSNKSYFRGAKIFLNNYFPHLKQKNARDRFRRAKFFSAGLDLAKNTTKEPTIKIANDSEVLMRFVGKTREGKRFYVQVRKNKRGNHYLMSTFPDINDK